MKSKNCKKNKIASKPICSDQGGLNLGYAGWKGDDCEKKWSGKKLWVKIDRDASQMLVQKRSQAITSHELCITNNVHRWSQMMSSLVMLHKWCNCLTSDVSQSQVISHILTNATSQMISDVMFHDWCITITKDASQFMSHQRCLTKYTHWCCLTKYALPYCLTSDVSQEL